MCMDLLDWLVIINDLDFFFKIIGFILWVYVLSLFNEVRVSVFRRYSLVCNFMGLLNKL